jgi:hypothetical protein
MHGLIIANEIEPETWMHVDFTQHMKQIHGVGKWEGGWCKRNDSKDDDHSTPLTADAQRGL